jgi:hypothetical protein
VAAEDRYADGYMPKYRTYNSEPMPYGGGSLVLFVWMRILLVGGVIPNPWNARPTTSCACNYERMKPVYDFLEQVRAALHPRSLPSLAGLRASLALSPPPAAAAATRRAPSARRRRPPAAITAAAIPA